MKAYKGFDRNLKCRGFQYEVGQEYMEEKAEICKSGFHACENPMDVLKYYNPANSRFCEVDLQGNGQKSDDSKIAGKRIKVLEEIGLPELIKAGVEHIKKHVDWNNDAATNTGYCSAATNTGNCSVATNTGYYSVATNTGDRSAATVEGAESIAIAAGMNGEAKGAVGCFLVLAEWTTTDNGRRLKDVKAIRVDGERIKADTFYTLKDGEFTEKA